MCEDTSPRGTEINLEHGQTSRARFVGGPQGII